MSLSDFIPEKFLELFSDPDFSKAIKGYNLFLIKEDPEYRAEVKDVITESYNEPEFRQNVDYALLDSESKLLPRLKDVEIVTGLNTLYLEDEEHAPTLPERISRLEESTVLGTEKPMKEKTPEPLITPKSSAEKKAVAFAEWLFKKPHSPTGIIQADDKEIKEFINSGLPEKLRGKDKSERKIKMRIINKVKEMYPNIIDSHKSGNGRHETSVFVKNSFQSTRTVRAPLMLAGVML